MKVFIIFFLQNFIKFWVENKNQKKFSDMNIKNFLSEVAKIFLMISTHKNLLDKTFSFNIFFHYFYISNFHSQKKNTKKKSSRMQKKLLNCYHLLYHLSNEIWSIIQRIFHKYGYDKEERMLKYRMSNHLCWYWLFIYWFEWLMIMKIYYFYSL